MRCYLLGLIVVASTAAWPQTFTVMYNFGGVAGDPIAPSTPGTLAQGRDGNIYATSPGGGDYAGGALFKITPAGAVSVVYSFGGIDGLYPISGVTLGTDGNFYGACPSGGAFGYGNLFRVTPAGGLTVLHDFTGGSDGGNPTAAPIQSTDGSFYGTTTTGGTKFGHGTVYKLRPSGSLVTLHQFNSSAVSSSQLMQASDGNFYGTVLSSSGGAAYKISAAGTFTVILSLNSTEASSPIAPLIQANDGNFYGTTTQGGAGNNAGSVFQLLFGGGFNILHGFDGVDGAEPYAGLVQATDGNLYGATISDGSIGQGTAFRVGLDGTFSVLYNFGETSGIEPSVTPLQHTNGLLYGDTGGGGAYDHGTFYSLDVGLGPFVSLVPGTAKAGKTIGILGMGLTGAVDVEFNGVPAVFTVASDTFIRATVPPTVTSGFVTVVTSSTTLTSNRQFQVLP
jgi:uncharacterized repeat protein (TIGR03803 family)